VRVDPGSLKSTYLQHTDYHRFPGGLKKLEFIVETLCRLNRDPAQVSVLSLGCGNGSLALPVASLGYRVLGVDIDRFSIEYARQKNTFLNARFEVADGGDFEPDERFDAVICSEVLEHLADPLPMIRTIEQAMEDDGLAIITVPNGQGLREVIGRLENFCKDTLGLRCALHGVRRLLGMPDPDKKCIMHTLNVTQDGTGHVQFFSLPGLKQRLARGGLEVVKVVKSFLILSVFAGTRGDDWTALDRLDSRLADLLPASMASGWYLLCRKARK
jgi:SAM-dependent methyltransferase